MRKHSLHLPCFAGALGLPGQNFHSFYMKLAPSACRGNMGQHDNGVPMKQEIFLIRQKCTCAVSSNLPQQTGLECLYVIKLPRQTGALLVKCHGPGFPGQDFLI